MLPRSHNIETESPTELRDKALNLRESVNSSKARMSAQAERLENLRREIAELRALIGKPAAAAVSVPVPAPAVVMLSARVPAPRSTPVRSAPIVKEAAPVSAAATASSRKDAGRDAWRPVPYIAIFFVAVGMQMHASRLKARAAALAMVPIAPAVAVVESPAPILDDGGAEEALLLAHEWRLPGDERPLSERLGSDTANPPGTQPEWTAERTGERMFRVTFKQSGAEAGYDFDVDLAARRVDPTPDTAALISPRLASRR